MVLTEYRGTLWRMASEITYLPEAEAIASEFPGWEAWASLIGGQWHARIKGATPPVMLHDDSPAELREQIRNYLRRQSR